MKETFGCYEIGYAIDPGKKRAEGPNQDSLIVLLPEKQPLLPLVLVVADGMGGYSGGALASQTVIKQFKNSFNKQYSSEFDFQKFANESIDDALIEMQKLAESDSQLSNMGSTVVALAVGIDNVNLVNIGDSHAYLIREGKISQINYDHSFVGEAVRAGLISKEEAINHPKKNQLTQSINARKSTCKPFFTSFPIKNGDLLLLCSDGLWGVVQEAMIQTVASVLPPQQAADKLVKLANSRGGPDNISVIICKRANSKLVNITTGGFENSKKKNTFWSSIQ